MVVIFDGEAQFTIDGSTSLLKGPVGSPCRMGHSHAIYNPTNQPVQWMNIDVSAIKGDAIPIQLNDVHSFENTSGETLESMIVGISRDNEKSVDMVDGVPWFARATEPLLPGPSHGA